jgi:hypothetical protein
MDIQSQTDLKAYADRLEVLCRAQADEIDRLRAVVAKLTGTDDAHSTLRRLYLDEAQSPNARIRAATAALVVEKPRLAPEPRPLELTAKPIEDLATLVHRRRARQDALQGLPLGHPKFLEWIERDESDYSPPSSDQGNGNGSNDGDAS